MSDFVEATPGVERLFSDDEFLLAAIVSHHKVWEAPVKTERYGEWCEFIIGIGNDHTASITMDKDSYDMLIKRVS